MTLEQRMILERVAAPPRNGPYALAIRAALADLDKARAALQPVVREVRQIESWARTPGLYLSQSEAAAVLAAVGEDQP